MGTFPKPPDAIVLAAGIRTLRAHVDVAPRLFINGVLNHVTAPQLERATLCEVASGEPLVGSIWAMAGHPTTCPECLELSHA